MIAKSTTIPGGSSPARDHDAPPSSVTSTPLFVATNTRPASIAILFTAAVFGNANWYDPVAPASVERYSPNAVPIHTTLGSSGATASVVGRRYDPAACHVSPPSCD